MTTAKTTGICPFCGSKNIEEMKHIISPFNQKDYKLMNCFNCCLQFFIPLVFENVYETEVLEEYVRFHQGKRTFPPWTKELIRVIKKLNIDLENKKVLVPYKSVVIKKKKNSKSRTIYSGKPAYHCGIHAHCMQSMSARPSLYPMA